MVKQKSAQKLTIKRIKRIVVPLLKKNGVTKAGIFGSYARREAKNKSDIDLLIQFRGSLLDLVKIERELKIKLGRKVDLLTYGSISPYLKEQILRDEVRII